MSELRPGLVSAPMAQLASERGLSPRTRRMEYADSSPVMKVRAAAALVSGTIMASVLDVLARR